MQQGEGVAGSRGRHGMMPCYSSVHAMPVTAVLFRLPWQPCPHAPAAPTSALPTLPPWNWAPVGEGAPCAVGSPPGSSWISATPRGRTNEALGGNEPTQLARGAVMQFDFRNHFGELANRSLDKEHWLCQHQLPVLTRSVLIGWVGAPAGPRVQLLALLQWGHLQADEPWRLACQVAASPDPSIPHPTGTKQARPVPERLNKHALLECKLQATTPILPHQPPLTHPWRPAGVVLDVRGNALLNALPLLALRLSRPGAGVVPAALWVGGNEARHTELCWGAAMRHMPASLCRFAQREMASTMCNIGMFCSAAAHLARSCAALAAWEDGLAIRRRLLDCRWMQIRAWQGSTEAGSPALTHLCWALP